jgi:hypothetical protein
MSQIVTVPGQGEIEFPDGMSDGDITAAIRKITRQGAPVEQPGMLARGAKWLGETAADTLRGAGSLIDQVGTPVAATIGALGSYAVPHTAPEGATFGERWKNEAKQWREAREESQQRSPTGYAAGSLLPMALAPEAMSGLPSTTSMLPATTQAANVGARALGGVLDAATYNAAAAGLGNVDRDPLGAAGQAASSPMNLVGAAAPIAGAALPQARASLRQAMDAALRKRLPQLTPTPAARELMDRGVPLTLGQMAPDSALGHIEEASAERLGGMAPERRAAAQSWRQAALRQALPPGMAEVPEGAIQDQLAQMHEGFDPAYGQIRERTAIPSVKLPDDPSRGLINRSRPLQSTEGQPGAFELAIQDPSARARDSDVAIVKKFLDNELSLLPGGKTRPDQLTPVSGDQLLAMRSHIGQAAQEARLEGATAQARLLDNAHDAVTATLESQLPPDAQQHLRQTDRQYGLYKTIEGASQKQMAAGQEGEFTPYQLEAQIKSDVGGPAFARGGGNDLRALGHDGNAVFGARAPLTGFRATLLDQVPGQKWIPGGLLSRAMNAQVSRDALLRLPPQPDLPGPVPPTRGAIGAALPQVFPPQYQPRSSSSELPALAAALRRARHDLGLDTSDEEARP